MRRPAIARPGSWGRIRKSSNAYANINGMRRKAQSMRDPYAMFSGEAQNAKAKRNAAPQRDEGAAHAGP